MVLTSGSITHPLSIATIDWQHMLSWIYTSLGVIARGFLIIIINALREHKKVPFTPTHSAQQRLHLWDGSQKAAIGVWQWLLGPDCQKAEATFPAVVVCSDGACHSGRLAVPTQLVRVPMERQVTCPSGSPGQPRYSTLHTASQSQMQGNGGPQPLAAWNVDIPKVKAGSSLEVI